MTQLATSKSDLAGLPEDEMLGWLGDMIMIRRFEETADDLSLRGKVAGGIHPAIGQEAVAVGVARGLDQGDIVTGTHRSHHHALAKGMPPNEVLAELYGKASGSNGGRGGSMHLADFDRGLWGTNGIVGAGIGIAMGAALGAVVRQTGQVAAGFFGDGGANTGRVWEFVNLAAVWKLPLIAICENNLYAVETPSAMVTGGESVAARALGFGLPAEQVDGQDVVAVYRAVTAAAQRARSGGPTFLEIQTYRYRGHNTGEVIHYRTTAEVDDWRTTRDPIDRFAAELATAGILTDDELSDLTSQRESVIADAVRFADEAPWPDPATATNNVTSAAVAGEGWIVMNAGTYSQAFQQGMQEEMGRDDTIFVVGTDIYDRGGHFAQLKGLGETFGHERVRDAPISEAAMVAAGVGAALNGCHPLVDLNFMDFAYGAMDEIINQAAKIRYMWGRPVPLVIRATAGVAGGGAQHNNSLQSWFTATPGLTVVFPSRPWDVKGLIKSALRAPDPIVFMMHKRLSGLRGDIGGPDDVVPIGAANVLRGGSDVTIVTYGYTVVTASSAAATLAEEGIECDVIDLRTLYPLDLETILESVRRTGRVIVLDEAPRHGSLAAEIAATIQEEAFFYLDQPVRRVTSAHSPIPHSPTLLDVVLPNERDVVRVAHELLSPSDVPA